MKWYDVEYSGGKSSKNITGQSNLNLDELLNMPEPPKFIKIENVSYYSKLSKKYELFDNWDSKWENEIWINTSSIISIRKIKDNLYSNPSEGEWNAFSDKFGFSIILSKKFTESLGLNYSEAFLTELKDIVEKKSKLAIYGNIKITVQSLLPENELIIHQFGNVVLRKKVHGDIKSGIRNEIEKYLSKFSKDIEEEE